MDVIPKRCLSPKSIPKILIFLKLLLVPAATWREISFYILKRPDRLLTFFSQDKKWISVKIFFISKFLVKTKNVNFSFFTFSRLLMTTFSFLHILNFSNFAAKALRTRFSIDVQMGYCYLTDIFCDVRTTYIICFRRNDS